ncbi:UBX domain-containing protein 11-like [Anneissia japonica]|uniref:UBX domain-containing protein 11-like n=1 Tax=Anneissia japonica TaxID=1529436 RepID=UPI0014257B75|nr:UBX domain-containing protein 11-like [Anneissia japonica]
MFNGPFRFYEDPSTKMCIQDLTDGFFPTELKTQYPDGTPFLVTDKREVYYQDPRHREYFPGAGQTLGGTKVPSKLIPTNLDKGTSMDASTIHSNIVTITSETPAPKLSLDQFLEKLPQSIVKNGNVIDIRSSISSQLASNSESGPQVTILDTPIVKSIKERVNNPASAHEKSANRASRPSSARNVATLRVKSEAGNETYILKLAYEDTIGDVRRYIDQHR